MKRESAQIKSPVIGVAPRAGAWIETGAEWDLDGNPIVAPRAGAWIETGARI